MLLHHLQVKMILTRGTDRSTPKVELLLSGMKINQPQHTLRRETLRFKFDKVQWYLTHKKHPPPRTLQ